MNMRTNKRFTLVIIILVLVAVGFGVYKYLNSKNDQNNFNIKTPIQDWIEFSDDEFGISFKYPPEMVRGQTFYTSNGAIIFFHETDDTVLEISVDELYDPLLNRVLTLEESMKDTPHDSILVGNREGVRFAYKGEDYLYIQRDGHGHVLMIKAKKQLLDEIIPTIQFLDTFDRPDLQIYRNEKNGFELRFPKDWSSAIWSEVNNKVSFHGFWTDIFYIQIMTKEEWQRCQDYKKNNLPQCAENFLAQNDRNVFAWAMSGKDFKPEDEGRVIMVKDIVSTFKFTK